MKRSVALLPCALLVLACAGSEDESLTAIRVSATIDPQAKLTQLQLQNGERVATVPEAPRALAAVETVTVMLDDAAAGVPLHIDVWGLSGGARMAHGTLDVTPERHRTIDASTTLAPIGCIDECQANATQCTDQGVARCGQFDEDTCLEWGTPTACPSGESCAGGTCTRCAWSIASVDATTNVGPSTSLEVGRDGAVHVSYWDQARDALNYAYRPRGGAWAMSIVDGDHAGEQSSLAVNDADGSVHIAYARAKSELKMADSAARGGAWTTGVVDTIGSRGPFPSLAVSKSGALRLSYMQGTQGVADGVLRFAERANATSAWALETVDDEAGVNAGEYASLVIDPSDRTSIAYSVVVPHDLRVAERVGSGWAKQTVDASNNVGAYASLAVDAAGTLHASYYDYSAGDLKYAFRARDANWQIRTVDTTDDVGRFSSIAVSAAGDVYIAYYDSTRNQLKYARRTGDAWFMDTVETVAELAGTSIAVDDAGGVHVSYSGRRTAVSHDLRYAYLCK
ncbi:hypothetical protein LZC95_26120 [Pendulispora brunnea]|uniref:Uncharacterized protein n=1 Tax=Pendulispora brunnea TaxID=2905690 RepID=A0ABZ2JUG7_9BACT